MASVWFRILITCFCLAAWGHASAAPTAATTGASNGQGGWTSRCTSVDRKSSQDCTITQRLYLKKTGRLFGSVTVRMPADAKEPVIMIQTPLDLFLPAGVTLSVDGGDPAPFVLQTCDVRGCYAGSKLPGSLLSGFVKGQTLSISFQDLKKRKITVPMPLAGFAAAYARIK